ncbi:hypothetical protein [uncultured Polaribacter sp.]|uniref:hypothetical protein n=1 Tax=uncultured Polaribacter sp. TaxID=174711 RepID=UPI002626E094|nr:hypothetical protein [uncultured Polaribacter sp.]
MKNLIKDLKYILEDFKGARRRKDFLNNSLIKVRISSNAASYNSFIINQTPNNSGIVNNTIFYNDLTPDFDFVINKPNKALKYNKKNSFLLHIEPPKYIRKLDLSAPKVVRKFKKVFTTDQHAIKKNNDKFILSPPFVHWHLGGNYYTDRIESEKIIDYNFLEAAKYPEKSINLSTINSNLTSIEGHKVRADFIEKLCKSNYKFNLYGGSKWANFKQYIDNAPKGKWFPFSKSRYVLVIENEKAPFYWSEKFSDAVLSFATPIYYGCTNMLDYFPEGSFYPLDINERDSIEELKSVVESDFHEKNMSKLIEARALILKKYNLFSFMSRIVNENL